VKVYILSDLEGVGGVTRFDDWSGRRAAPHPMHRQMATLMLGEINAAVAGAVAAGAETIVVRDGHGYSDTVPAERLHAAAWLSQGPAGADPLPHLDPSFDALVMVGQHARAGNPRGCLSHTYSRRIRAVRINGAEVGEIAIQAALAGEMAVPVVFVSGDSEAVREARAIMAAIETVETKVSHSRTSALSLPRRQVLRGIRDGVRVALERLDAHKPFVFAPPVELGVAYHRWYFGVVRLVLRRQLGVCDFRRVPSLVYRASSLREAWRAFARDPRG
jgi:D-amino peptidase